MKRVWYTILALSLILFCIIYFGVGHAPATTNGFAKKGWLDLRRDSALPKPVALEGEWGFFWNRLLVPGDQQTPPAYVSFPSLWRSFSPGKTDKPSLGYASYMLTIVLPPHHPSLSLEVPETYSAQRLFVNGQLLAHNGVPDTTAATSTPFWSSQTVPVTTDADTLHLLLQVANYWHVRGGPYKDILLGRRDQLILKRDRDMAFDVALAGCLFMGGLFFLGLYTLGRHDKPTLFFSLFCILYSYRMVGAQGYVLHSLLPHLSWFLSIRLEYITLLLSAACFGTYVRHLYPDHVNKWAINFLIGFALVYTAMVLLAPPHFFTQFLAIFLLLIFGYVVYALYTFIMAAVHQKPGATYALISSGVILLIFFIINLHYFGLLKPLKLLVFLGYISFFFLQSLALSHRFAHRLRLAADLAQQGLKAKSDFLSTMSHEIRTPLNAVIGMAHILRNNQPREDQQEQLNVLMFSASNLLSIVNNILDYTKIEEGKINFEQIEMNLPAIAGNIFAGLRSAAVQKDIELQLAIDERLNTTLIGDPTRASQIINNLVHNAIKFTQKGTVKLSMDITEISNSAVTILFRITDTGIGIAPEKLRIIFDRFTQADSSTSRSFGGTGLGLAITRRILQLQGSQLHVKSEQGKGSEFYFTQTFRLGAALLKDEEELNRITDSKKLEDISVLLVEDNEFNVMVAKTLLERAGASVTVAGNGLEALKKFDQTQHNMILMDLHMPLMDGYEATRQLRRQGVKAPIIAITASMPKEVETEVYGAGLSAIMVKPFNPVDLYRVVLQHAPAGIAAVNESRSFLLL